MRLYERPRQALAFGPTARLLDHHDGRFPLVRVPAFFLVSPEARMVARGGSSGNMMTLLIDPTRLSQADPIVNTR